MGTASIGIKLADSTFFPVLEEGAPSSKILDLTTIRDNQTSVQINLFRNSTENIETAEYVGTLIIEDIAEKAAGEPTIELTLTLDDDNELSAEAVDLESGSRQVLTVSLETLDGEGRYSIPDFDLAQIDDSIQLGYDPDHENVIVEGPVPGNPPEGLFEMNTDDDEKRGGVFMPAWLCVTILAIGVLALVLALIVSARVMFQDKTAQEAPVAAPVVETPVVPAVEPVPEVVVATETPTPAETPAVVTPPPVEAPAAPVVVEEPVAPVQPEPAPEAKDIHYKIKWGDTLWDISESYYKNPWLYPRIAKFNKIKNPNLIISGTYIDIPAEK